MINLVRFKAPSLIYLDLKSGSKKFSRLEPSYLCLLLFRKPLTVAIERFEHLNKRGMQNSRLILTVGNIYYLYIYREWKWKP